MQKIKKTLALIGVLSLVLSVIPLSPGSEAAQLMQVSDTITDSKPGATAGHTFSFTTQTEIPTNGKIEIMFNVSGNPGTFNLSGVSGTCPGSGTFSTSTNGVTCTYTSGSLATGTKTLTVNNVVSPNATGSYLLTIETKNSSNQRLDYGEARIALVSGVTVTAHVPALLTFEVKGLPAATTVESGTTNVTSTATAIDFGTVNAGTEYLTAQKLVVSTNANYGFSVKVWQNQNLTNAMGNDIDRFKDGVTSTNPQAWASPTATPGSENTYGHFGLRSDDSDVEKDYGTNLWIGFYGDGPASQHEVLKSTRPTAGESDNQGYGWDYVEYKLQISALQEAGDYSNTLTYICTPTY